MLPKPNSVNVWDMRPRFFCLAFNLAEAHRTRWGPFFQWQEETEEVSIYGGIKLKAGDFEYMKKHPEKQEEYERRVLQELRREIDRHGIPSACRCTGVERGCIIIKYKVIRFMLYK